MQKQHVWAFYLCYAAMGLMTVVIFINLIHEACHGNIFRNKKYNDWVFYLFELIGANSYIWKKRHLLLHHRFPNTIGWDCDIEQSGPITIFPAQKIKSYQKYQHRYIFFLYPLFMLNWLLLRDFKDIFSRKRTIQRVVEVPAIEKVKLVVFKFLYLTMMVGIPWLVVGFTLWQSLAGLLVLTICGSLLALFVLLTAHVNLTNYFPVPEPSGQIPLSWFRHQLMTVNDIEMNNWFIRHVLGNFNYHLAHHIFPTVSNVYAPEVTAVIKDFAVRHDLPYRSFTIGKAMKMHYQLIRHIALRLDDFEM
jgi:linoleoyl-CoA desaturase